MVNPFSGPPVIVPPNPGGEMQGSEHREMWGVIRKIQVGQARLEERMRFNWLLGLVILGAILSGRVL